MIKKSVFVLSLLGLLSSAGFAKTSITPVTNFSILGGQYWLSNSMPTSLYLNASLFFSPVVNFNKNQALLPIYSGSYNGVQDVRELVGGGVLTQETQDHSISFKYVTKVSDSLKLKARAGYKMELVKETKDESWGKGLFDYNRIIGGIEFERLYKNTNLRAGVDYYRMLYPNYSSLISNSSFETALDTTTYSEVSANAGTNVLDYNAGFVFVESIHRLSDRVNAVLHYDYSMKSFADQRVPDSSGEFTSTLRQDSIHQLNLSLNAAAKRASITLSDNIQLYDSNQNSYDMANSQFFSKYYNFVQNDFSPSISFALGKKQNPSKLTVFWNIAYRAYSERLAQNSDGTLKTEKTYQITNTTGISLVRPLNKNYSLKFSTNYLDANSNMKYEKSYKYNYYTFNYFAGITCEY